MVEQIFTFGFGHGHVQNGHLGYVIVRAATKARCRELMVRDHGKNWAFQYDSKEAAGVDRFNLYCVDVITETGAGS